MELTKDQSFKFIIKNAKFEALKTKYRFTTKYKWWCLHCLKPIFVSYKQYGRNSIFCEPCYVRTAKTETVAQYQYMRILKENQMKLIEYQLYFDVNNKKFSKPTEQ